MVKKFLVLIFLLSLTIFSYCQIDSISIQLSRCDEYNQVLRSWVNFPTFDKKFQETEGDLKSLLEFIQQNLRYPKTAKKDKIEGTVFVEFWVDTCGFTSEHKIKKSIRHDLDKEALRVAKLLRYDIPATDDHTKQPVGICITLPIRFKLE